MVPPGAADGHEHLTHIDRGTRELAAEAVVLVAAALHLGREAELHAEVGVAFLALRREGREGGEQAGAVVQALEVGPVHQERPAAGARRVVAGAHVLVHREDVDIAGKAEGPAIAHLHREGLGLSAARGAKQQGPEQQSATLHRCFS
jgi:hypothetical protein